MLFFYLVANNNNNNTNNNDDDNNNNNNINNNNSNNNNNNNNIDINNINNNNNNNKNICQVLQFLLQDIRSQIFTTTGLLILVIRKGDNFPSLLLLIEAFQIEFYTLRFSMKIY